jgi:signal transduction histidine kinase
VSAAGWLAFGGWLAAAGAAGVALGLRRQLGLVADADHELRGPVTAIALIAEALAGTSSGRRHAAALSTHLDRLRIALRDLESAREGRRAAPRPVTVPLEDLLGASLAGWDPTARRAGGGVRLDWRAGPVAVRADRERLAQALGNAIGNAVEHGGARVALRGERLPGRVRLEVADRGGGGERPLPGRPRRGGRGLAIAGRAVRDAGGSLDVRRSPEGTTVAIELPVEDGAA